MKSKNVLGRLAMVALLQLGLLAGSAQTNRYLFTGAETSLTLNPGTYLITVYGAEGSVAYYATGGLGAEMGGKFTFYTATTLTLLVGGAGSPNSGGGGGGSFVVKGSTPLVVAGGGGGGNWGGAPLIVAAVACPG